MPVNAWPGGAGPQDSVNLFKLIDLPTQSGGFNVATKCWFTVSNATVIMVRQNQVDFTILNVGPDASIGAVYSDNLDATRLFLVAKKKVDGDLATSLVTVQIGGSSYPTNAGAPPRLNKVSGSGDATIDFTAVATYAPLDLADGEGTVLKITASGAGGYLSQIYTHAYEAYLKAGRPVIAGMDIAVGAAGDEVTLKLLDSAASEIATSSASTSTTWTALSTTTGVVAGTYTELRIVLTANGDIVYIRLPQVVSWTSLPAVYRKRGVIRRALNNLLSLYIPGADDATSTHVLDVTTPMTVEADVGWMGYKNGAIDQSYFYCYCPMIAAVNFALSISNPSYNSFTTTLYNRIMLSDIQEVGYSVNNGAQDNFYVYIVIAGIYQWEGCTT